MIKSLRENWYLWIAAVATAGYPLISVLSVIFSIEGRGISIGYRACALLYVVSAGVYLLKQRRLSLGLFGVAYLIFWLMYSGRLVAETLFRFEDLSHPIADYYLFAFLVTLLPSLVCFVRLTRKEASFSGTALWALCFFASAGILATYFLIGSGGAMQFRFSLRTLNPISMGQIGATLALMSVFLIRSRERIVKTAAAFGGVVGLSILLVAASRGPIIAFLSVLMLIVFAPIVNRRGNLSRSHVKAAFLLILVLSTVAMPLIEYIESNSQFSIASRFRGLGSSSDESGMIRTQIFKGAWSQFIDNPLFGDALEERKIRTYPHNNILEAFLATGILGGSILLGLYVATLINCIRLIASRDSYAWIGAVTLQYLLISLSSGVIWGSSVLFCLMALASRNVRVAGKAETVGL